ncbi:MAG TPA: MarR family transcriptional regulator [Pseudoclavibacter sp.]|nr:MarR family transcriptional regulator [Pseudoclavibacter sp.]
MSEARWLTPGEMDTWLTLIAVAMQLPPALDAQLRADAGITHFEYYVMAILSEAPQRRMRLSDLADRTNGTLSRLSHTITKLVDRGWVTREASDEDARATVARLTEQGWDKVVATAPGHVERVRRLIFDHVNAADVAELGRVLAPIRAALDQEIGAATRREAPPRQR